MAAHPQNTTLPFVPVFKYTGCRPCPRGKTCAGGAAPAQACAAGSATELLGSTGCTQCPPGAAALAGATTCQECAPGAARCWPRGLRGACAGRQRSREARPSASQRPCRPRPLTGSLGVAPPATGTVPTADRSKCELCPAGTYSTLPGAQNCTACPAGTYREEGGGDGTKCTKCPPGTFPAPDKKSCVECAVGSYSEEGDSTCRQW